MRQKRIQNLSKSNTHIHYQNFRWCRPPWWQRLWFPGAFHRMIPYKKRTHHMMIAGATGSGKSELLKLFIKSDMLSPFGAVLIDPHSDLADACNRLRLANPSKKVVYLSSRFGKAGWHFQYNPFQIRKQFRTEYERQIYISKRSLQLVEAFATILRVDFTVNMRLLVYNVLMLMHHSEGMRLRDFLNCMRTETSSQYVKLAERIPDRDVRLFFAHDFHKADFKRTKLAVLNRFSSALGNRGLSTILDCQESSFDFGTLLNSGAIVLVDTHGFGSVGSSVLGSFLVAEIFTHALARANVPTQFRRPIFLYIDECQEFMNPHVVRSLQQARKFGLHLCLAFQDSSQFPDLKFRDALLANTAVKICGATSAKDLLTFCREFPRNNPDHVPTLSKGRFLVKISGYHPSILTTPSFLVQKNSWSYLSRDTWKGRLENQLRQYYRFYPSAKAGLLPIPSAKKSADFLVPQVSSVL